MSRYPIALVAALLAGACTGGPVTVARFVEPALSSSRSQRIDADRLRACHSRDETPAVIETVTDYVAVPEVRDAQGNVLSSTVAPRTRQTIVTEREEIWFETPCHDEWTPEFLLSVQRALIARGLMSGPPTGQFDGATRRAIRAFQAEQGIDSDVLSVAAGKRLGLIVYDRAEALME